MYLSGCIKTKFRAETSSARRRSGARRSGRSAARRRSARRRKSAPRSARRGRAEKTPRAARRPSAWPARRRRGLPRSAELKGSIGGGPNHSNFSDRSSVRILGIQRKPRKAPARKKPLQRSSIRPKIQEGAARMERKGKQTALRERGVRRPRTRAKDARLAIKRCYACLQR